MPPAGGAGGAVVVGVAVAIAVRVALGAGGRRASAVLGGRGGGRAGVRGTGAGRGWLASLGGGSRRSATGAAASRAGTWPWRRAVGPGDVRVVVAQVAALLRAGAPPGAAWTRAAGVPVDALGVPQAEALGDVVGRSPARAVAAATRLALTVGAPLGRVLEAVSDTLAAQADADAEREAALAGPRATARVLWWLPAVGVLLGWALGADPWAAATDGGAGTAAVCGGLVLLAVGRWWTGRLVAAARKAGDEA
ncbi:hypothetical protein ET495_14630 [Xylanimonas allomyrinae]|uniref:Type II secretion system protein GspF domain-containing protein n=1 Tax=Xylanimonas allomyrinae TaxID=2509459 RepID=A0A4P6ETG8_9MICO|nr:hypothetical protein ET495_14630 [Xylanimonas allomyrinae]